MSFKTLRKVSDLVDVIMPEDHNDQVDNWNEQLNVDQSLNPGDPDITTLIQQLQDIVSQMRKVKMGDYLYAQDHNLFVDAWNIQVQINDQLKNLLGSTTTTCTVTTISGSITGTISGGISIEQGSPVI